MKSTPSRPSRISIEILESRIAPAVVANIDLTSLDGSDGLKLSGVANDDFAGGSVAGAGDVNGDGFADFIIGASGSQGTGDSQGAAYVVFGKAGGFPADFALSSLNGQNGFRVTGEDYDSISVVNSAGDVNGDGFDDVIVAPGTYGSNRVSVVFGKASGFSASMSIGSLNGSNGFHLTGIAYNDSGTFGTSVASAGDVNGDGFDDVIVGQGAANGGGEKRGSAYVVYGKASGFAAELDVEMLDGVNGFTVNGAADIENAGVSVSGAGDVNGDGFDDVIISAPYAFEESGGQFEEISSLYVVFGKASGIPASFPVTVLNGSNGFRITGDEDDGYVGESASGAGDVNGDGYDDVIMSARATYSGHAFVVFGKAAGFGPIFALSSLNGANGFEISDPSSAFPLIQVDAAGDINGDGFDDVIMGRVDGDELTPDVAYVVFGKASGFAAELPVANLDEDDGFTLTGTGSDSTGSGVGFAGDVNGDGYADIIVGASGFAPSNRGAAFVVFGFPTDSAPAQVEIAPNGKSAIYTDWDGDIVTIKTTKGALAASQFVLSSRNPATGGFQLFSSDFSAATNGPEFDGASLTFSAKRGSEGGNGFVNVGFLNAAGTDLGVVTIGGDLSRFTAGTLAASNKVPGVKSLTVESLGMLGTSTQEEGVGSTGLAIKGALAKLSVLGDLRASVVVSGADGKIGSATIGGSIVTADDNLTIHADAGILSLSTGGDIRTANGTIEITSGGAIGSLKVAGSIAGTSAALGVEVRAYGQIATPVKKVDLAIGKVTVAGNVEFTSIRAGAFGDLNADASIGSIAVGNAWIASIATAGTAAGADLFTGTGDDAKLTGVGTGFRDTAISSSIGSIAIKGQAFGTAAAADMFGIVAEVIGKAKIGARAFAFTSAATQAFFAAPTGVGAGVGNPMFDFIIREFGAATPAVSLSGATVQISGDGKTATYTDVDGDVVTIKRTVGTFAQGDFTVSAEASGGGQLRLLNITPAAINQAVGVSITAKPGPDGGNGFVNAGRITAAGTPIGVVQIVGDLGQFTGGLSSFGKAGVAALEVNSFGSLGLSTGALTANSSFTDGIGKLTTTGDLRGVNVAGTGAPGQVGALKIGGIFNASVTTQAGIGTIGIAGSFRDGTINAGAGPIGTMTVGGDLISGVITAFGRVTTPQKSPDLAIKSITVKGNIEGTLVNAGGFTNGDASIGTVSVGRSWIASTVVAGAHSGSDTFFGTQDDRTLNAPPRNEAGRYSTIASVIIKRQAIGTSDGGDHFGIVAEQIGKAQVGKVAFKFAKGEHGKNDVFAASSTGRGAGALPFDFYIRELRN